MTPVRVSMGLTAAVLALATAAGVAFGASAPLRFSSAPARVAQGAHVSVTVAVRPASTSCSLAVRYKNGATQAGLGTAQASGGRASWAWDVPVHAAIGRASVTARCAGAGKASRALLIVGGVAPLRVDVVKSGFSVRAKTYGGSDVSYGVLLQNRSQTEDALSLNVLVNFVMSNAKLIGSASSTVQAIPAGSSFALGGNLSFDGAAPVARLEVVVTVQKRQKRQLRLPPTDNIYIEQSSYDEGYVGAVDGELVNDQPKLILQSAQLSSVVLDADGNIVGGATGFAFAALPPSTREFFKLSGSVTAIPMTKASSAIVSVTPTYVQPGS